MHYTTLFWRAGGIKAFLFHWLYRLITIMNQSVGVLQCQATYMNCWVLFCCIQPKVAPRLKITGKQLWHSVGLTGNKSSIIKEIPETTSFVCNRNDHLPLFLFAAEGIHGFSCMPVTLDGPETELQQFSAFRGFQLCISASALPTGVSHCCLKLKINTTCM